MKTPERRQWCRFDVFIVSFEHVIPVWAGLLAILIGCMIFLTSFLDAIGMSMSTISFLVQLTLEFFACKML